MQASLLVVLLVAIAALVGWGLTWWRLVHWKRRHASQAKRMVLAEWWSKNAVEFSDWPSRLALESFAVAALKAPDLATLGRELARVASPAKDASGAEQWPADPDVKTLITRARGALGEVRHGAFLMQPSRQGVEWKREAGEDPYDRRAGGAWQREDLIKATAHALAPLRSAIELGTKPATISEKT